MNVPQEIAKIVYVSLCSCTCHVVLNYGVIEVRTYEYSNYKKGLLEFLPEPNGIFRVDLDLNNYVILRCLICHRSTSMKCGFFFK